MASRLKNPENLRKPILNFKLLPNVNFSISSTQKLAFDFQNATSNRNDEVSRVLKGFVFARLGVKNKKELKNLISKIPQKNKKHEIYKRLGVDGRNSTFTKLMEEDIEKYLKNNK